VLGGGVETRQNETLYDEDISIVSVGRLAYPAIAASARIQGVVVVTGVLDDRGAVIEASPLSGHKLLIDHAVASVRTSMFKPNAQKRLLVVIDFQLDGGCHRAGDSQIRVVANVVRVTSCVRVNF
jgi:hypothetical protein